MKGLLIPESGPLEEVEFNGLADLQRLVGGGYIEAVAVPDHVDGAEKATCYVNEEGNFRADLGINRRAMDFLIGVGPFIAIQGPMLLCGFDPRSGEHTDQPPEGVVKRARLIESEAS